MPLGIGEQLVEPHIGDMAAASRVQHCAEAAAEPRQDLFAGHQPEFA